MMKPKKNPVTKLIGAGVKAAAKAAAKKADARGLKAANKDVAIKYKKGLNSKNFSGRNESKPKQVSKDKVRRPGNQDAPMTRPSSYKSASVNSRFMLKDKNSIVLKEAKPAVRVKPAAKPIPNKPNAAKTMFKNDSSRNRASDRTIKEFEKNVIRHGERPTDPSFGSKLAERVALNTQLKRKPNLKKKAK